MPQVRGSLRFQDFGLWVLGVSGLRFRASGCRQRSDLKCCSRGGGVSYTATGEVGVACDLRVGCSNEGIVLKVLNISRDVRLQMQPMGWEVP